MSGYETQRFWAMGRRALVVARFGGEGEVHATARPPAPKLTSLLRQRPRLVCVNPINGDRK